MKFLAFNLLILTAFLIGACTAVPATSTQSADEDSALASQFVAIVQSLSREIPVPAEPSASCPATVPPDNLFVPPSPYPPQAPYGGFWFGSPKLWTSLHPDGKWAQLLRGDKIFWWRDGYDGTTEPAPLLTVTGRRTDGASTFTTTDATNALHQDFGGWTMLTGVQVPEPGCWEITGEYDTDRVIFVVYVAP